MPFMILLFFMCTVVAISQMPLLMIVLRSVDEEERSFALGVQFVIFRLIAYIPAPIMFGSVIDSDVSYGRVRVEKKEDAVSYMILKSLDSAAIFVFDWLLIRWKYKLDMEGTMTVGDIVNSLMSVDKDVDEPSDELEESVWLPGSRGLSRCHHRELLSLPQPLVLSTGHKRSQSGSYIPSRPWAGLYQHRLLPAQVTNIFLGHLGYHHQGFLPHNRVQRRASSGQQVTFRGLAEDPSDLTGVRVVVHGHVSLADEEDVAIKV
ncbi:Solute carrier organic anion transporter family member 5A1-like 1 [Homarus americanus]|uniref:Solute carrier organic anion transporter family member 5A1-like 1 n=1 Tax=Homarus americanus TaxID=6706 RepID=A0A8J5K4T5_HOMAM|nr:Solute carrier organic anion transporter family member 5A1-like 1 [Homarus americanus]